MKRLYILATAIIIAMFSTILNTAAESESKYTSTFIQSWLCRDWSEQRWDAEFSAAKDVGFDSVILQSVIDLTYEQTDTSKSKQNFESYSLSSVYSMYKNCKSADVSADGQIDVIDLVILNV